MSWILSSMEPHLILSLRPYRSAIAVCFDLSLSIDIPPQIDAGLSISINLQVPQKP